MASKLWYIAQGNLSKPFIAVTIHCREDVRGLRQCGWDATLFSQADEPVKSPEDIDEVVVCKNRPVVYRIIFELALAVRLLTAKEKPAFVMFRGTGLLFVTCVLVLLRIPFGVELCGPPRCFLKKSQSLLRYPGDIFMLRNASAIIALTRELAELASEVKKNDAVVSVTGVGVNSEDYQVIAPAVDAKAEGPVLGFLGTLYPDRGLGYAIESVAELNKRGIKARLVVVGDGPYRGEAEQLTAKLGIGSQVDFKGWIKPEKVSGILAECDLMLALYERSPELTVGGINPMKVWTSLATGKATLLYNPGSFDAYSGIPGIFSSPNTNPGEVAELVAENWKRLGKAGFTEAGLAGRKYVEENVTWLAHTRVIDKTIKEALGKNA